MLPRPSSRWVAAVVGIWIAVAGGAILVARELDSPVGAGARDEAQPAVPGPVAQLDEDGGSEEPFFLALFPPDPLPAAIAGLPPAEQVARLRALVAGGAGVRTHVALGAVLQGQGDGAGAAEAYRGALEVAPGDLSARVGLAMVTGAQAPPGPDRAAARLARLASAHPRSQVVLFNQGVLAVARQQAGEARAAWQRTVALGPRTRLGLLAARALQALQAVAGAP
jgi:hypothetical protein